MHVQINGDYYVHLGGDGGSFQIGIDHCILLGSDCHPGNYGLETVYTITPKQDPIDALGDLSCLDACEVRQLMLQPAFNVSSPDSDDNFTFPCRNIMM